MAATIRMDMTVDEKRALQAMKKLAGGVKEMTAEEKKAVKEAKALEKANVKLGQEAKRVWNSVRSPMQKYNEQMKQATKLLGKKKLTVDQYRQAQKTYRLELQKEIGVSAAAARGAKVRAERIKEAERAGQKEARMLQRKAALLRQVARESHRTATASRAAFGSAALSRVASYAAGVLSIATAIRAGTAALRERQETANAAAQRQRESELGLGSLGQLALGDPEKLQSLVGMARQTYAEGGAASMDEAGRFVFQVASAGAMKDRKLLSDLRSRSLVSEPGKMAAATAALNMTMGVKETGGTRALISKGFGASAYSPSSVEDIIKATAGSGASAGLMGMRDEPLMAATAVMATAKVGAEQAGTWLAQMMRTWKQKGTFHGKTFEESLAETERVRASMDTADFKKWFGRAQGQTSFEILWENRELLAKATKDVEYAERTDAAGRSMAAVDAIPELIFVRQQRQAKARRELGELPAGRRANIIDTFLQEEQLERRRGIEARGGGEFATYFTYGVQSAYRYLAGDQAMLELIGKAGPSGAGATPETRELARQELLLERIANSIDDMNQHNQPPALSLPGTKDVNNTQDPNDN